jgi:peptide/nickel transport system substrate-binding protein
MTAADDGPTLSRRQLLGAATAASVGATSGCVSRLRSILNRDPPTTVSLSVTTPPADDDRTATLIARQLVDNLKTVGIDATLNILPLIELNRQVLLNRDFDLFIGQLPPVTGPDSLRPLLHSRFSTEAGWQNPFSYASVDADRTLDRQRATSGDQRLAAVQDLCRRAVLEQPFTTVAYPDEIRAVRTDRFTGWERRSLQEPLSYVGLESATPESGKQTLRLAYVDSRISQNLNPLSIEYRRLKPFTDLLYDSLARQIDGAYVPWLARDWDWQNEDGTQDVLELSLRPGQVWHDGVSLTAGDVAFTFRFLSDTSLDNLDQAVPAPLFRGLSSLVTGATAIDDETVKLRLERTSREVGRRVLTAPILPEHVWLDRTSVANVSGFGGSDNVTDALVSENSDPVGSGPVTVDSVTADQEVVFLPFENHFLTQLYRPLEGIPEEFVGTPDFDRLRLRILPSNETAVALVDDGSLDGTATAVDPRSQIVEAIGTSSDVSMLVERSQSPYQIGFNTATQPFSDPYFRRMVARLIDKQYVVDRAFRGYGTPVAHALDLTRWNPDGLTYDGEDPEVPFFGSDGRVDEEAARQAFVERGYEFDDGGSLILQ